MKLLLVNKLYHPDAVGGAEAIARSLAEAHRDNGLEVTVATTGETDSLRKDHVGDIPVLRLPLRNFYWHSDTRRRSSLVRAAWHVRDMFNTQMERALTEVIRRVNPHVIAFHNLSGFSASAWAAARATRKPALQVLHDYYHLCPRSQLFSQGQRCERRCTSCSLFRIGRREQSNQLQGVVAVSQSVLDTHLSHGLFEGVQLRSVIHNGVTLRPEPPPAAVPLPPAINQNAAQAHVFGFIGTLGDYKGIEALLEAFREAHARHPALRLRVAGSGESRYVQALRQRYAHGSVEFLGRTAASEFFRTIDALIVPSLWDDPLPTVILEAQSAGVPVVGARRGGIPELITPHVDGLLYDPSRPGDLTRCLLRLATEPGLRRALATGCQAAARGNDQRAMARAHERVYEQLLEARP
ncbi:MAG: glycosyltransferase family 4 protein [Polyangiales bacterium]